MYKKTGFEIIGSPPGDYRNGLMEDIENKGILSSVQCFNADGALKSLLIVRCVQAVNPHGFPFGRSVHKLIIADIDAHMSERTVRMEKDEIAFDKFLTVYFDTDLGLFAGDAGQFNVKNSINFLDERRAVETLHGGTA